MSNMITIGGIAMSNGMLGLLTGICFGFMAGVLFMLAIRWVLGG